MSTDDKEHVRIGSFQCRHFLPFDFTLGEDMHTLMLCWFFVIIFLGIKLVRYYANDAACSCANLGFPGISWRTHYGNGQKFCMLMYLDHLWRWWLQFVDFCNFGAISTSWNGPNLGFPGISQRTHGGNDLKFCMLLYPGYLQNWLDYGHSFLIFLILVQFWVSEMGQIWGCRAFLEKHKEGMAWKFACWFILVTSRNDQIMVTVCWLF